MIELTPVWLEVRRELTLDVEVSVLTDNMKDVEVEEVTDAATLWDLELMVSAPLESLVDETNEILLCCDTIELVEVGTATALDDDRPVAVAVVDARLVDIGFNTETLAEMDVVAWLVHVALSLGE